LDIMIAGGRHWMSEQLYVQSTTRTENHSHEVARTDGVPPTMPNRTKDRPGSWLPTLPGVLLYFLILASPAFGQVSGGVAVSPTPGSYSLGDTLYLSAIGTNKTPFKPLSLLNFGDGWLEPWIPPPNSDVGGNRNTVAFGAFRYSNADRGNQDGQ
jgi:hypothetical protein